MFTYLMSDIRTAAIHKHCSSYVQLYVAYNTTHLFLCGRMVASLPPVHCIHDNRVLIGIQI